MRGPRDYAKGMYAVPRSWDSAPPTVIQDKSPSWEWSTLTKPKPNNGPPTLYLLVCPSRIVSREELGAILVTQPPFSSDADSWAYPLDIRKVTVPMLAPTSPEQAAAWSEQYWPTFYRKTNPFGAHPATIARAELELQEPRSGTVGVEEALALAEQVAREVEHGELGAGTGCVIVERDGDTTEIIAVAGDARRKPLPNEHGGDACCQGNIMAHSVMRAIGMVGRKRLRVASQTIAKGAAKAEGNFAAVGLTHDVAARDAFFVDLPVNTLEAKYFQHDNIKPDGYLCLKLEVYLTHEPCMMCSMALVHSRVGKVIFKHRMPETGGLTAEKASNDSGPVGLGYGLCWRKELNWQFMCWEYRPTSDEEDLALRLAQAKLYPSITNDISGKKNKGETPEEPEQALTGSAQLDGADERELDAVTHDAAPHHHFHHHHHGELTTTHEHMANPGKLSFASISV